MSVESIKADILIVDDTPANLQVLSNLLKDSGYKVRAAPNGLIALRTIESKQPDLLLLDVNMPEMNGYEVCQQLKSDPATAGIPIIFISALNETLDKVKAFELGAADYITKPFQFEEVQARVALQLKLLSLQRELLAKNHRLEASLQRQRELELQRENLVHMMVHDMRSPLSGMLGYLSLLERYAADWPPKHQQYLKRSQESTDLLINMLTTILDIHKMDSGQMPLSQRPVDLFSLAQSAVDALGSLTLNNPVRLEAEPLELVADPELLKRVLENLLANALKFSPAGAPIEISFEQDAHSTLCRVRDQGPGIPPEMHERIFDKFGQLEARKHSTGLGLTFCKLAIQAHQGEIGLESEVGQGSCFWFRLPNAGLLEQS